MEKYLIYYNQTDTSKKYLESIYRNSVSTDIDIGESIEFTDKETALKVADYLNKRENENKYKVMHVKTILEEIK